MTAIDTFYNQVRPEVRGCSEPMMGNAVLNSAVEFCKETGCWQETLADITLVDGTKTYTPTPPAGGLVFEIVRALHDSRQIFPRTEEEMDFESPGWEETTSNFATHYVQENPRTLRVFPFPDSAVTGVLKVKAVIIPDIAYATPAVPDFVAQDHVEAIAAGAKWKLMAMPGMVWSNAEMAGYYEAMFVRAKTDTRIRMLKAFSNKSLKPKQPLYGF